MFRAKELQRACPRSHAWLLQAFEQDVVSGAAPAERHAGRFATTTATAAALRPRRPQAVVWRNRSRVVRPFSTSRGTVRQEAASSSPEADADADSMETVVRQARATFGDTLPPDYLSEEEYKLYQRLYGDPLRPTQPSDVGIPGPDEEQQGRGGDASGSPKNALLRETDGGLLEEVAYAVDEAMGTVKTDDDAVSPADTAAGARSSSSSTAGVAPELERSLTDTQVDYIQAVVRNKREYAALAKLQKDFEAATLRPAAHEELNGEEEPGEEEEEEEEEEEDENEDEEEDDEPDAVFGRVPGVQRRLHHLTLAGRSRTHPSTLQLPKAEFVAPISELLRRADIKHVREAAHAAFGGPGLPDSPASLFGSSSLSSLSSLPPSARPRGGNRPQRGVALAAGQHHMSEIEADAYLAAVLPGVYATAMSTLVEVRKRLGAGWLRGLLSKPDGSGPRVLDAGGGGAALAAWNAVLRAERDAMGTTGAAPPPGVFSPSPSSSSKSERTVVVGSDALRHRLSRFLQNTTFLPRLPDLLHSAANVARHLDAPASVPPRKTYDVVLASHLLLGLAKPHQRRALLDNLWAQLNPAGGVLIVLEKGHPRGFEAVADARQRLLDEFIVAPGQTPVAEETTTATTTTAEDEPADAVPTRREPGMIIAPCTNHTKCPMYLTPGLTEGRKDFCRFSQRFIRPPFLQRLLGASHRNHEDIEFSYVAVRRGDTSGGGVGGGAAAADAQGQPAPLPLQGRAAADAAFAGYEAVPQPATTTANFFGAQDEAGSPAAAGGEAVPHPLSLPRTILNPLKRRGHVILDVCTPAGQLERWTVPRSRSVQAYHDARKARWGDLWALGAKTRVARPVRLGRKHADGRPAAGKAAGRGGRPPPPPGKNPAVVELKVNARGRLVGAVEKGKRAARERERRAKSGRQGREDDLLADL